MTAPDNKRRGFLAASAVAVGTVAIAPGIRLIEASSASTASTPSAGASAKVRWAMLIDTTKCVSGCDATSASAAVTA